MSVPYDLTFHCKGDCLDNGNPHCPCLARIFDPNFNVIGYECLLEKKK